MQQIWDYGGCTWCYRHVPYKALSLFSFKIENTRKYIQKFNVFGLLGKLYGDCLEPSQNKTSNLTMLKNTQKCKIGLLGFTGRGAPLMNYRAVPYIFRKLPWS